MSAVFHRPPAAKVTGVVEESPGPLEYEVGLYREAKSGRQESGNEVVVEQAVPIGTKLQLRASINTNSGKYLYSNNKYYVLEEATE